MGSGLLLSASRLAGAALLLVCGAYSGQNAVKSYLREADPKAAYSADPSDGLAAVNAFASELKTNPQFIISSQDAGAARASLVNRPLNASLLSFYGLRAASIGQSGLANALMASADTVSRRDALSQLWMIEQKSGADDVKGAVSHYNALLSVHPAMQATFLPVLVSAVAYPEVRAAIRPYLTPATRWSAPFLDMASQRVEVDQYRDLVAPIASRLSGDEYAVSNARIIYRMLQSGVAGDAWKLFSLVALNVDVGAFRAFAPGGVNLDPKWQPLSWTLGQSDDISASVSGDGTIDVTVAPTARGLIASRNVAVISSSTYVLGHRSIYEPGSPPASLRWSVYCAAQNGPQLIVDRFVPATANSKLVQLSVEVPENCNLVRVELSALGSEGQLSSPLKITELTLTKTN
ncbi:hypothetical protein GGR91_002278 [Sphingorhabdus rigui]|uniref:Uncharacterized protein n=1 Tax=Sphingorhabdus rigui TaxID=1282858 RepID=A0A840B017_9SPHN|nr:hypothetical protein [Sphingorhabdus rigui]MBB3944009.1 hypothetical protein [Sphingorhabdus rigui]